MAFFLLSSTFWALLGVMSLCLPTVAEEAEVSPGGMVSIIRSIEPSNNAFGKDDCNFAGKIVLGGFFSLESDDKFFAIGNDQLTAFHLIMDEINRYRCGVELDGRGNFSLELRTYDDQSSTEGSSEVGYKLVNDSSVDVMVGGYSSTLTLPYVEIATLLSNKLVLAPGAASTKIFVDSPLAFGMFPPSNKYLLQAIEALATVNEAKTMATVWEDASFTRGVCAAAPDLAETYGMTMTSMTEVVATPNATVLEPVAKALSEEDPDVVITCVYDCAPWIRAMRNAKWSPKAQVFTVCVGQEKFSTQVGTDTAYIMGVTPWDSSLQIEDAVTGWTPSEFAARFRKALREEPTADVSYQAAMAGALVSLFYQTIENLQEFRDNGPELADYISKNSFKTMGGNIGFDENGQSKAPSLMVQYDAEGIVQTVYPPDASSAPILYPMPSWDLRDCVILSLCESIGGNSTNDQTRIKTGNTCDDNGMCVCGDTNNFKPVGVGPTANCIPLEEMNYISYALKVSSWCACAILLIICAICLGWTWYYRTNTLVKVSQPLFLAFLVFGSILSSLSILAMGVEAGYREDTENIGVIDFACMAFPWLWGMGFAVTYSTLFAKVLRVRKLYKLALRMRRQAVSYKDVYYIMCIVLAFELSILIAFQVVSPHTWQREVLDDIDGYAIESIGSCHSETGWWFFAALVGVNVICLCVALVNCWLTKDIPSDFAESGYIFLSVMFMFQILLLAIPVSAMVREDVNVFFFIRVAAVFLQNFTVLALIFLPKMRRIYTGEDTATTVMNTMRQSVRCLGSSNAASTAQKDSTFGHRDSSVPPISVHSYGENRSSEFAACTSSIPPKSNEDDEGSIPNECGENQHDDYTVDISEPFAKSSIDEEESDERNVEDERTIEKEDRVVLRNGSERRASWRKSASSVNQIGEITSHSTGTREEERTTTTTMPSFSEVDFPNIVLK